jgi:hypothetical protein
MARWNAGVVMGRSVLVCAFMIMTALLVLPARSQDGARPPAGGVSSPQGAMIFYLAHGQAGACGSDCSDWIAAEGTVQWDTFKRLLAVVERLGNRKLPIVLNAWGDGNLSVAVTLGKIIREHGFDVSAGTTVVADCVKATEAECLVLKRSGKPVDAGIDSSSVECDIVCVLVLAGGVHRTLPADARVIIGSMQISSRLASNVSAEGRAELQAHYSDQFRLYLTQMGVRPEVVDIIDRNSETRRATRLSSSDWLRLGIATSLAL